MYQITYFLSECLRHLLKIPELTISIGMIFKLALYGALINLLLEFAFPTPAQGYTLSRFEYLCIYFGGIFNFSAVIAFVATLLPQKSLKEKDEKFSE